LVADSLGRSLVTVTFFDEQLRTTWT